jgi:hypothetical protein
MNIYKRISIFVLILSPWFSISYTDEKEPNKEAIKIIETTAINKPEEVLPETYIKKEILFTPWGKGENQIELTEITMDLTGSARGGGIENRRYGPSQIEVDKESNIYIVEGKRIMKYNSEGEHLKNIILPYKGRTISNFELDKDENILLTVWSEPIRLREIGRDSFRECEIEKYSQDNELIKKYKLSDEMRLLLSENRKLSYILGEAIGRLYENYRLNESHRFGLNIIDIKTGEILKKMEYQGIDDSEIHLANPIGEDAKGNIYVLLDNTNSGPGGGWILKVYKYSKEGILLAKVNLPFDEWTDRSIGKSDSIRFDKDGYIYQILSKEDGVHLLKWSLK